MVKKEPVNKITVNTYRPNYAIPPGETLRETIETCGMTQTELAERTGMPIKAVNAIITGKASIAEETALHFERVLSVSASFWNNLERNYQEARARMQKSKRLFP